MDQGKFFGTSSMAKMPYTGFNSSNYITPTHSPHAGKFFSYQAAYLETVDPNSNYHHSSQHDFSLTSPKDTSLKTRADTMTSKEYENLQYELKSNLNLKEEILAKIRSVAAENERLMAEMRGLRQINNELRSQVQNPDAPSLRESAFDVDAVIKQRDYFQAEYQRVVKQLQKQDSFNASRSEIDAASNEFRKDVAALKQAHQGELTRLNQTIATLQLENTGLKNLRNTLEAQLEKFKDHKRENETYQTKLLKLETENTALKNKIEASNAILKSQSDEFEKIEAEYKNRLRQTSQESEMLKNRITEMSTVEAMRTVLLGIENERLHGIISELYQKIQKIEWEEGNSVETLKSNMHEALEHQKKAFEKQFKDLEARFIEVDTMNKARGEEIQKLKFESEEFEKELEHWKERYRIIENSHRYLVDAVDKMRYNNQIDLNVSVCDDEGGKEEGVSVDAKNLLKEANFYKEKSFALEKRSVLYMIEIERLQSLLAGLLKKNETQETQATEPGINSQKFAANEFSESNVTNE